MADRIAKSEGRRLFGSDPSTYDLARPGHAELVYEVLIARCGLRPGSSVLEVGPGTLYSTFSPIRKLDDDASEKLLDEIAAIAERDFDGRIERTLATSLYIARKPT